MQTGAGFLALMARIAISAKDGLNIVCVIYARGPDAESGGEQQQRGEERRREYTAELQNIRSGVHGCSLILRHRLSAGRVVYSPQWALGCAGQSRRRDF